MKVLVFGVTKERAVFFLKTLIGEMKYKDIKEVRQSKGINLDLEVILTNGDRYQVASATDSSRACKADRVYIDTNIDSEFIMNVIEPMVRFSTIDTGDTEKILFY